MRKTNENNIRRIAAMKTPEEAARGRRIMKPLSEQQAICDAYRDSPFSMVMTSEAAALFIAARNDYPELIEWAGKVRPILAGFLEMLTKEAPVNPETLVAIAKLQQLLGELQP